MHSLFSNKDLKVPVVSESLVPSKQADALPFDSVCEFTAAKELDVIRAKIGELLPGRSVWFKTDGAWSNYHLLEYILNLTGPAEVYFTTWAISEVAITKFLALKEAGLITDLYAVIDTGLRNRKPQVYQQAVAAFPKLKIAHCHAKATVVISKTHQITFIGSANYTRNPRKEVGVILWDNEISQANAAWIKEEINGTD
ncbi:MAG: hypothetical protein EOP45_03095 [Sphingobacteriaceae bacterium]|nr:MAG: hypothetical protein EOP45_03095 [Sphingobacteriaceae bacterium]